MTGAGPVKALSRKSAQDIVADVARSFGLRFEQITGKERFKSIARARHVAAYVLRRHGLSFPEIGRVLGHRDHTSAMHAVRKIERSPELLSLALAFIHETGLTYVPAAAPVVLEDGTRVA